MPRGIFGRGSSAAVAPPLAEPPRPAGAVARSAPEPEPESGEFDTDDLLEGLDEDLLDAVGAETSRISTPGDGAPAPGEEEQGVGLPSPRSAGNASESELDLPSPSVRGEPDEVLDLPATPIGVIGLPSSRARQPVTEVGSGSEPASEPASAHADLPSVVGNPDLELDLPQPRAVADLPSPRLAGEAAAELPAPRLGGSDTGDEANEQPKDDSEMSFAGIADELELEEPAPEDAPELNLEQDVPLPKPSLGEAAGGTEFGEVDLGAGMDLPPPRLADGGFDVDSSEDVALKSMQPEFGQLETDQSAGEEFDEDGGFGELELDDQPSEVALDDTAEAAAAASRDNRLERAKRTAAEAEQVQRASRRGKRLLVAASALVLILGAGGAALGATPYGFFGLYLIEQYLPAAGDPAQVDKAIADAERVAKSDAYVDVKRSLAILGTCRHTAGVNRRLLARSLVHEALFQVRFGAAPASAARSAAILARLEERGGQAPGMALARAADALSRADLARVSAHLVQATAEATKDPYPFLVAGEHALVAEQPKQALEAFRKATEAGGGARALWGVARAMEHAGAEHSGGLKALEAVLEASPRHAAARAAKARLITEGRGADDAELLQEATRLLEQAAGLRTLDESPIVASKLTRARALTSLGRLHERAQRNKLAHKAYVKAIEVDGYQVRALMGAGRVLLKERRHADALARFESALSTAGAHNPTLFSGRTARVEAEFGTARAQLSLARNQEAKTRLAKLVQDQPKDAALTLWYGKSLLALQQPKEAEKLFKHSIALAPEVFDGYLALSQLYAAQGKPVRASKVLSKALTKVPDSPYVHTKLGQAELARGRVRAAKLQFRRALAMDEHNSEALFGLGVATRRSGRLDEALKIFSRLESSHASPAGLAQERGLLYEAQGDFERAAESYRSALESEPDSSELLLRLAGAQVSAGTIDEAAETLKRVSELTPNSAEGEYLLGRVALARGKAADALSNFDRALALDGTRAEFHLHAARAALQMSNLGRAHDEVKRTLGLDKRSGDAYWVRAIIRLRAGVVRDAIADAKLALKYNPARHDAHAVMGDSYEQMRKLKDAIRSYRSALVHKPKQAYWWYRLGRLQLDNGEPRDAAKALARATELGDAEAKRPGWLADAHRIYAESIRKRKQSLAIEHYQRYLELAPASAIDRRDVIRRLRRWGVEPVGRAEE